MKFLVRQLAWLTRAFIGRKLAIIHVRVRAFPVPQVEEEVEASIPRQVLLAASSW